MPFSVQLANGQVAELTGDSVSVTVELQGTDTFWEADVTVVLTLPSITVTVPHTVPPTCVTLTVRVQFDAVVPDEVPVEPLEDADVLPPQPATSTRRAAPRITGKRRTGLASFK